MAEMTIEQQRAITIARARRRRMEQQQAAPARPAGPDPDVPVIGAPVQRPMVQPPDLFSGQTLQVGPFDTGIQMPEEVTQGLVGIGSRFADVPLALRSIKERINLGGDAEAINREIEAKRQIDAPVMQTTSGQVGSIIGDIGIGAAIPIAGTGMKAAALAGAAMELTKPKTMEESYLQAAATGAATGAVVQGGIKALTTAGKAVSRRFTEQGAEEAAKRFRELTREGIEPDITQIVDSEFLDSLKSRLHSLPFTATKQAETAIKQTKQFNRRVLATAGINADTATPEVIDRGFDVIGKKFDDLLQTTDKIKINQKALDELSEIAKDASTMVTPDKSALILKQVDDIMNRVGRGDEMTGESYKALRTTINNLGRSWRKNQNMSDAAPFMRRLVSTLDDSVGDSFGAAKQEAWKKARSEYATLSTIVDSNAIDEFGMISANKLYTKVRNVDKKGFARGKRGELARVATVGKRMQSKIPDSGTAGNLAMQNMLTGQSISPTTQETSTLINSVLRTGEGWVLSKSAQGVFNSPILRDILLNRTPVQQPVVKLIKAIEDQAQITLSPKVRAGMAKTIRAIQNSQLAQKLPGTVGTASVLPLVNEQ